MEFLSNEEVSKVSGGTHWDFVNDAARWLGGATADAIDSVQLFYTSAGIAGITAGQYPN